MAFSSENAESFTFPAYNIVGGSCPVRRVT